MTAPNPAFINRVLELTNEFRAENSLPPLTLNPKLNAAAQEHSEDMAQQDKGQTHIGSNASNRNLTDRVEKVGYEFSFLTENVAGGQSTPEDVVKSWIQSKEHRDNMLNSGVTELGVGYAYQEDEKPGDMDHYWTQVLARSKTDPAPTLPTPSPVLPPDSPLPPGVNDPVAPPDPAPAPTPDSPLPPGVNDPVAPPDPVPAPTPVPTPTKGNFQDMLDALGAFESGFPNGDPRQYQSENQFGFIGKYQFGEPLLTDLGYYKTDNTPTQNDWQNTAWTGKDSITSKEGFKNATQAQETAIREAFALNLKRMNDALAKEGKSVDDYLGQVIKPEEKKPPITISLSGLLAGAHLRGPNGVADLLLKGIVAIDEIGTPITKYVDVYGGYDVRLADLPPVPVPAPSDPAPIPAPIPDPTPVPDPISGPTPIPDPTPVPDPDPISGPTPVPTPTLTPAPIPVSSSLAGTEGDDVLVSRSDQGDSVLGLAGNDRITGRLGNDSLSGGAGDDTLFGEAGNDSLDGGLGNDAMSGGLGNDSYMVDSSTDVVMEAIDGGMDTVFSSAGYALSDNVENLTLTDDSAVNGTGNSLDNVLVGNAADNYLYAGDGADRVDAQAGNDYLYGEAGNDQLNGEAGKDWLIGDLGDDLLSGGGAADRLVGGLGRDSLSGGGGKDRLTGGADADRFIFNNLKQGFDIITDFQAAQGDRIVVAAKGLGKGFEKGSLSSDQFTLGARAVNDQGGFIYNESSGQLFFDRDGVGGQGQIQVAKLTSGATLTGGNILIA